MLKFINKVSNGMKIVKAIAAFADCVSAAATAWHEKWQYHFPDQTIAEVVAETKGGASAE